MGELISAAVLTQIARVASEVAATLGKSTALGAALAQEGVDVDVLGRLLGALSLRPREQYAAALVHAAPLHGRFASNFLAQVLPEAVPTVQLKLAESAPGRALLLLVSGLACAAPPRHVLSLLRELLALSYGLPRVADLPEAYLCACSHAGTIALISEQVQDHLEWYTMAFDAAAPGSRRASARELAALLLAFGRAQGQEGAYVRIRNLCGIEPLLAALSSLFGAAVRVGPLMPRRPSLNAQEDIAPTEIVCEFGTGLASVALVRRGAPVVEYLGPGGVPAPKSLSSGQLRASARSRLARAGGSWAARAATGAYVARAIAADLAMRVELAESEEAITKLDVIARDWVLQFGRAIDVQPVDPPDYESVDRLTLHDQPPPTLVQLLKAAGSNKTALQPYLYCLDSLASEVQALWGDLGIQAALSELWLTSYLEVIYGGPVPGLELRARAVERWKFPAGVGGMLSALEVLPAYDGVEGGVQGRGRAAAAVQAGAFVLLPRLLAEEGVGTLESSLLLMLPGVFRLDGVAVDGFFPEECEEATLSDLRDTEPPADASASSAVEYHYAEAERGYALRVLAAGYDLPIDAALKGLLRIRRLHAFPDEAEHTSWLKAAPHHAVAGALMSWFQKTVYLSHCNEAGRLLAFARIGERRERLKAVFFEGEEYRQALAYADRHQCKIVIL